MKSLFLTFLFFLMVTNSYSQIIQTPSIKANIQGIGNDTIFVMYYPLANNHNMKRDTLVARENAFFYQTPLNEPTAIALIPRSAFYKRKGGGFYVEQTKFIELFVRPTDKIKITGKLGRNYLEYLTTGSRINKTISQFRNTYKKPAIEAVKIELLIDSLQNIKGNDDLVKELFHERGKYFSNIMNLKIQFVNQYPDNNLSAYFISRFSLKNFALYYPKLTPGVRDGMFSAVLKNKYQNYLNFMAANKSEKRLKVGVPVPDFTLKSYEGSMVSLSDYKGKIIVLDFWGTWCPPCMKELPKIKSLHHEYGSKVKFIGIACNEIEKNWRNTIIKNKLDWLQLLNSKEKDVSILLGIKTFPTKIVIGKDFKIIGRYVGINEEFYDRLKKLAE